MISTGGEGKISAKKRLRGKIGDPSKKPELKQFNLLDTSEGIIANLYNSVKLYGTYNPQSLDDIGVWRPLRCQWPKGNVGMMGRIGKKIRIKYLRIKGYVAASPFLINQVRYRLVLYRTRINLVQGTEVYNQAWLASLYKEYNNMETASSNLMMQLYATENYYMSFFDKDELKSKDCKRRVLLTGLLKPSEDIGNYVIPANSAGVGYMQTAPDAAPHNVDTITGQAAGSITRAAKFTTRFSQIPIRGEYMIHDDTGGIPVEINSKSFFPIDLTVTMNDNVDCYEYRYVLVLESDWAVGQKADGAFGYDTAYSNFFMKIVPQIYYFDD